MPDFPIWTTLFLLSGAWLGWSLLATARRRRRRGEALSDFAARLPQGVLGPLHDHLLDTALAHYSERELRAGKTRLEYAVALRDCLDRLAGHEHGALNRARIRSRLLPAAYRLRGDPNPFRVREFRELHLLDHQAERSADTLEPMVQAFSEVFQRFR